MDELVSLLRILPDGLSVTAVIIVVILFLKHINELQEKQQQSLEEVREGFKLEIKSLTDTIGKEYKEVQEDVSKLLKDLVDLAKDCNKYIERIAIVLERK